MIKQNDITVVLGKKGSGKTSYAVNRINEIDRLVIFDFNREYEGFYVVGTPDKLIEVLRLNFEGNFKIAYRPDPLIDIPEHFEKLTRAIFCMTNMTLLAEEIDLASSATEMPEGLRKIINYGRHRGINLIALSRRAHRVPRDLTANADRIVSFVQNEPRDIRYLSDYMGEEASQVVTKLVRTESGAEFVEWSEGAIQKYKINYVYKIIKPL